MYSNIGFVGLGRMGANMARRLREVGYSITAVYDVNQSSAQTVAQELGAEAASSLARVTALADLIFTVVTDDAAQLAIFSQSGDSLLIESAGKIFINCATITPQTLVEIERRARAVGSISLEGCMASSIPQARNGTLYLMCSGDRASFEQIRPVLEKLS